MLWYCQMGCARTPAFPWFRSLTASLAVLLLTPIGTSALGQMAPSTAKARVTGEDVNDQLSTTRHSVNVGSTKLAYEATAGTLTLRDDSGKVRANIYFTAYRSTTVKDVASRPITFLFNGGPGSSSAWLHLGAFGPRRALVEENGKSVSPPYRLVDNEATLLDTTDLVFIDPVSTGYSRAASGQDVREFHGVREDVETTAAFIRRYVTRFGRRDSPKFLAGESYGAARAAALAQHLQDKTKMNVQGVLLISMVLNFQTIRFFEGNDLPYPLFLPTYAATAWHHQKLAPELQADFESTLAEVEKFAETEYTAALMKGQRLSAVERQAIAKRLANYTGLSEDYVMRNDLRIDASRFRQDLLRARQRNLGRYDSRFWGTDTEATAGGAYYDPSRTVIAAPLAALVGPYLRKELKHETELVYRVSTDKVLPWNYGSAQDGYVNTAPALRQAMARNPRLRVFVAAGCYDLATPYFATRYTLDHLGLDAAQMENITVEHYRAGHMMYIDGVAREKLKKDVVQFLRASLSSAKE
ncbi:MAG: hypothetical protein K2R98_26455 [Gemmataceae bacterium]|nr:hypothetical protein [Gemmataceae bacterium]